IPPVAGSRKRKGPPWWRALGIGAEVRCIPACWSGSLGRIPQTLIALSISDRTGLIDATTDLAQLPERVIRIKKPAQGGQRGIVLF
ncbi:hypothetical protein EFJ98_22265, partial [Pseudomonas putida]